MNEWKTRFLEWQHDGLVNGLLFSTRDLNRYLDLIENSFIELFKNQLDPLTDDETDGLAEQEQKKIAYGGDFFNKSIFPNEFYKSFLMSLYSRIEKEMLELCERELELKLLVTPSDTEYLGTGIHRAQKFLVKATGFTFDNHLWQELKIIGKVRNHLVHNDSPYITPAQKPKNRSVAKVHIESNSHIQDYYLAIDTAFYKHISKFEILTCTSTTTEPENELALLEIRPSYDYCRYLISFRKKIFIHIYNGLLKIAEVS